MELSRRVSPSLAIVLICAAIAAGVLLYVHTYVGIPFLLVFSTHSGPVIAKPASSSAQQAFSSISEVQTFPSPKATTTCLNSEEAPFCGSQVYNKWLLSMPMFATYWATPYPAYPVSWDEGNTHFDITSIHVGMGLIAPGDIHFGDVFDNQGRAYPTGTFFYAIRFAVKTSNKDQSNGTTTLANPRLYRLVDEQGDLVPGNERGGGTTFIIPDNEIIPPTDTIDEYTFTTGGSSNIFFYVKPSNNGSHIIEKEPMSD